MPAAINIRDATMTTRRPASTLCRIALLGLGLLMPVLSGAVLASRSAEAAILAFQQDPLGGPLLVSATDFDIREPSVEPGTCLDGPSDGAKCAAVGQNFYGLWSTSTPRTGPGQFYQAFLTEAGSSAVAAVVHIYWAIDGFAFMSAVFQADPSLYPTVPSGYFSIPETGGPQDITDLFSSGNGILAPIPEGLRIFVQTDAAPAPEPASMLLLTSGLIAAGLARRRTRLA